MSRIFQNYTILDAAAITGAGTGVNVQEFQHLIFWFATDGGGDAALTVKFQASISVDEPDWDSVQSVINEWDYIDALPYMAKSNSIIYGDDGISVVTEDNYGLFQMNCEGLKWINIIVTARTEGEVTVKLKAFSN